MKNVEKQTQVKKDIETEKQTHVDKVVEIETQKELEVVDDDAENEIVVNDDTNVENVWKQNEIDRTENAREKLKVKLRGSTEADQANVIKKASRVRRKPGFIRDKLQNEEKEKKGNNMLRETEEKINRKES